MLVPPRIQWTPSVATSGISGTASMESVEVTPNPGAEISGLATPSRRGPWLEKDAIAFSVGRGFQQ